MWIIGGICDILSSRNNRNGQLLLRNRKDKVMKMAKKETAEVILFGRKIAVDKELHDRTFGKVKMYDLEELELGTYMCLSPEPGADMKDTIWSHTDEEVSKAAEVAMETRLDLLQ